MFKNSWLIVKKLFRIFINNPFFFFKRIFLELKYFVLPTPKSSLTKKVNGVLFNFDFAYSDEIKKMFLGNYQPIISEILKKYLEKGDTFIDVGANIGYFTMIAAGFVGNNGQVHSFEPVKEYFEKLAWLARNNGQYHIAINQFALGDEESHKKIYISGKSGIGDNTFFPDFVEGGENNKNEEVAVRRFDKYVAENNVKKIKLIKIDVEGFEFPVLRGFKDYFLECEKTKIFPAIICEICPKAYAILGYKLRDLFDYMKKFSYYPFEIFNTNRRIDLGKMKEDQMADVLFKYIK